MRHPYAQHLTTGSIWKAGRTVFGLCAAYNHATCPSRMLTESEHARAMAYARAIRARMRRLGYVHGQHYRETESGAYWPTPNRTR